MLVGVLADERLGPVVACAAGGEAAQEIADLQVRLAPLAREEASGMVRALRTSALLERERADTGALVEVIVRIAALADAHPAIAELDCNPVIVAPDGAVAIDARVRVAPPAAPRPFPALTASARGAAAPRRGRRTAPVRATGSVSLFVSRGGGGVARLCEPPLCSERGHARS
jgi:hypothetical protein